jgi:ankyrin repeat protein
MYEVNALADAIKRNKFEEAKQRMEQGEKLPKNLDDFDKGQIYDALISGWAFELINSFIKDGVIETDIYEYDKFDRTIFERLFKKLGNDEADLNFLNDFLQKLDNINDALQDKTLLGLAFFSSAPIEVIKLLVDAGCDIHYKTNYDENFLYKIIQEYDIKEETGLTYLEYLIQEGLDPNAGNIVRETPLHLAISKNKKKYIELLLQNGADLNQQGKDGETPFYAAVVHQVCNVETYNMLKQYAPVDFDIANKNGETVLLGAVRMRRRGSEDEIQLLVGLINDGADVYQTSPYYSKGKSALDWISEQPADVLQAVLETGVIEIDRKDDEGNTLLHKVCAYNVNYDQEAAKHVYRKAKLLIEQGADVNSTNDLDQTPMDLAAQDNLKTKTVELLLKNKA